MSRFIVIVFLFLGFSSCYVSIPINGGSRSSQPSNNRRTAPRNSQPVSVVPQDLEKLKARIKIFHKTADTSRLYFVLDTRKQDYFLLNDKSKYKAEYLMTYEFTRNENGKKTKIDTASLKLVDLQLTPTVKSIFAYVETNLSQPGQYSLKLTIYNMNRSAKFEYYLKFGNTSCAEPENYLLTTTGGVPLLEKNFLNSDGKILQSTKCDKPVELYKITGGIDYPTPPFADDDFASANNYTRQLVSIVPEGNNVFSFSDLEKGIYSLQTSSNSGIVFYHFDSWYPNCSDTSKFYDPLVYICSKTEYQEFVDATEAKEHFEKFWLSRAGDKNYARKAINEYYKRVFEANAEYTSTKEGWRTDRGMVSVIFGKPSHVEKQLNREIWFYKTGMNATLTFTFNKIDNTYSDNDYRLVRELRYKPNWYNAVENWRSGRPFTLVGSY